MKQKHPVLFQSFKNCGRLGLIGLALISGACSVGPKYQRASVPTPPAYKESTSASAQDAAQWKQAQPSDSAARGKWWEIYQDPQLNALEEQVSISNQNVLAAEAQFRAAKDAVRIARSNLFPTVTGSASIVNSRTSSTLTKSQFATPISGVRTNYSLPVELTYEADVWGSIRHSVGSLAANAQASAAQLENARLFYQAELAQDYFQLHGTDAEKDLLERTVKSYEEYLKLTQDRLNAGVASGGDVAQAQAQLETAKAQLIDLEVARSQFEHAIAILVGKPPAELSIPPSALSVTPPSIPPGVPSDLLERRPDIAAAERQMAATNEQIGIAKAAYYPTLLLGATAGFQSTDFLKWFSWPSRIWSVGPQMVETIFDAGKRHAQVDLTQSAYDATIANYRQTVLTGFQQVEDHLAALRVLQDEALAQDRAVDAARRSLAISTAQYKAGTANYLQVIITQAIAFQDERTAVDIRTRRMVASVLLIEALGGGWHASSLPTTHDVSHGN